VDRLGCVLICRATPLSPEPRVDKIAATLKAGGYSVKVVGWNMHGDLPCHEEIQGIYYERLPVIAWFGHGIRNITHILRWQMALLSFIFRHRKEVNLVHACDFDTLLPALMAKWLWGKKIIYDIFDFYADMLQATPDMFIKTIRWLDLKIIGWVDGVVLADASRIQQIEGSQPKRMEIIYNCPEDRSDMLNRRAETPAVLRITYVGALRHERGLQILLNVLQDHPDWHLELAGFGSDGDYYQNAVKGMPNVRWYGRVSYLEGLQLNADADVLLVTYDPAIPNNRYASANKLFEAMMLGKPVIVARGTNMDRLVEEHHCGWVVDFGDSSMLEKVMAEIQFNPSRRIEYGENARQAYESQYNWSTMAKRLLSFYGEIYSL
jgi:glycosyltransferase involved in cell wall biosynthesis